jgi:SAM-dependent methyltransferase
MVSMPNCRFCNASATGPHSERHQGDLSYTLWTCPECTLLFWDPPSAPGNGYYDSLDFGVYTLAHTIGHATPLEHQRRFIRNPPRKTGRLLDIGCSDGAFLIWAQTTGFLAHGIDIDERAIARAQRHLRNVWAIDLADFAALNRERTDQFDVVTIFEVLEHQPDPASFLLTIRQLLAKGGWLAGTVPNGARLFKTGRGSPPNDWDFPPHHFLWFTRASLASALARAGFTDIVISDHMYGYAVEDALSAVGRRIKSLLLRDRRVASLPLHRLADYGYTPRRSKLLPLLALRAVKSSVKLVPKVIEATIETSLGRGANLYFQATTPR